jgi:hypothetical protein
MYVYVPWVEKTNEYQDGRREKQINIQIKSYIFAGKKEWINEGKNESIENQKFRKYLYMELDSSLKIVYIVFIQKFTEFYFQMVLFP